MTLEHNFPDADFISQFLQESASLHHHLCPRQVLGIRMGLAGLKKLGFVDERFRPRFLNEDRRLLTIMETDGCGLDGVAVATSCSVGKRTLRVVDHGKVAATLIDTLNGRSIRTSPSPKARAIAISLIPHAESPWHAYLDAYQLMPDKDLITIREVHLTRNVSDILSKPEARVVCQNCNEEIINEREVIQENLILCLSCAGDRYYEEC